LEDLIMKKLIMFLMVLMLCLGTAARADLDHPGSIVGTEAYSSNVPPSGSGGDSLLLDGASHVEIPSLDACIFSGDTDFSIVFWFKTNQAGALLVSASSEGANACETEHSMAMFLFVEEGILSYDNLCVAGTATETEDLDDGAWHHYALTYEASGNTFTTYIGGAVDGEGATGDDPDFVCSGTTLTLGNIINSTWFDEIGAAEASRDPYDGLFADVGIFDHALTAGEVATAKNDGFQMSGPKNPLTVDANDVTIYEDSESPLGDDMGNIYISLKFPPVGQGAPGNPDGTPISLEIIVDPNGFIDPCSGEVGGAGPNPDLNLIGGAGPNGQVSFTRNAGNWADVEVIRFQVVDDDIAEYPTLDEAQSIGIWVVPTPYEPNLARPVAQKIVGGTVMDNDQPDIIFTKAPPLQVYEYKYCTYWYLGVCYGWTLYPETVAVSLQVPPVDGGLVKLTMGMDTMGINNPPTTDPVIWTDPNILVFSADGATYKGIPTRKFDNPFPITVLGNDDDVLQAEDAGGEGGQNYNVDLVFHVVESGIGQPYDSRYGDYNAQDVWEDKIEKTFSISIEDNECGAYGTLDMDISNPYYLMTEAELGALLGNDHRDPNDWMDDDGNPLPDCHVDMYDVLEIAWRWFNCSDPQNLKPGGPCESYIIP
jgi:hypothetical protein